jgi:hypothetical protein
MGPAVVAVSGFCCHGGKRVSGWNNRNYATLKAIISVLGQAFADIRGVPFSRRSLLGFPCKLPRWDLQGFLPRHCRRMVCHPDEN